MIVRQPKTFIAAAFLAILLLAPLTASAETAQEGQIATVNGTALLRQDLDREIKMVSLSLARQGRPMDADQLKRYEGTIRENMISRALLLQKAQSAEISVKENLVDKALYLLMLFCCRFDRKHAAFPVDDDPVAGVDLIALTSLDRLSDDTCDIDRQGSPALVIRTVLHDRTGVVTAFAAAALAALDISHAG